MWHRTPAVAGSFYPADKEELETLIDSYMNNSAINRLDDKVYGVISPHAGYIYSGPIAAYSYKQLVDHPVELVIVLAPSHRSSFEGGSVMPGGMYETPLGSVPVDEKISRELIDSKYFAFMQNVHAVEHSLEVQVPFLQKALSGFVLVPIIIGTMDNQVCEQLAEDLYTSLKKETRNFVIIISTDLSHYYPYSDAVSIDSEFINKLQSFDPVAVNAVIQSRKAEACGAGPVLTGMHLCKKLGASQVKILKYANSGDTAGSKDQVVGYLSAAFI